jgi:hypothetical protein
MLQFLSNEIQAAGEQIIDWRKIMKGADSKDPNTADDWRLTAWHIFEPIAEALRRRVADQTVSFDVSVGDMHRHARTLVAAQAKPFDVIYLSNVPDYTGVHSALVEFRKLLRAGPTNFIVHNNLYNCSMWTSEEVSAYRCIFIYVYVPM